MKHLFVTLIVFSFPAVALASGSIAWTDVHTEILKQDRDLIAFIDQTFDVSASGGAMRPLIGSHAGERLPPYDFVAKIKGSQDSCVFNLHFDETGRAWKVEIQKKWY